MLHSLHEFFGGDIGARLLYKNYVGKRLLFLGSKQIQMFSIYMYACGYVHASLTLEQGRHKHFLPPGDS